MVNLPENWVTRERDRHKGDTRALPSLFDHPKELYHDKKQGSCGTLSQKTDRQLFGLSQWLSSSQLW